MSLDWATGETLLRLFTENFDANGLVKADGVPVLAKGTFAVVFKSEDVAGSETAAGYVVRVAVSPPGADQEFSFQKELQALIAYLKLTPLAGEPTRNAVVTLSSDEQPVGLCKISCYYVVEKDSHRAVITVMPIGKPLIDVIEEELVSASEMPGEQQPRQTGTVVKGMSELALGLKAMHDKNVYWRDCKVDNVVLVDDSAQIIDINSGVCTVGYASHEQLKKLDLPKGELVQNQKVTDAMEQVRAMTDERAIAMAIALLMLLPSLRQYISTKYIELDT